jgi:acetyltransferase
VIGASPKRGKVGNALLLNLKNFQGEVYPVNPNYETILGMKCYSSVIDAPPCELAVIAIPAPFVPSVVEECGRAGVKCAVVISAGFRESGVEGLRLEKEVLKIASSYGVRILGPNCLGVGNPRTGMNASFSATSPRKGNIAVVSQSGALLTSILDWADRMEVGFSAFVSLGNKADIDEVDLLEALVEDDETRVIMIYIEGVSDGRRFLETAKKVSAIKPVVVLKGGRTGAGSRAVSSHTGSIAGSESAYTAAFKQSGVIQASSLEELFDVAQVFAYQPLPEGDRVAIVTNAGGLGILGTDACVMKGLRLSDFSSSTIDELRSFLPPSANVYNPVDVLGDADADVYSRAVFTVMKDPNVDAVMCLTSPQAMTDIEAIAKMLCSRQFSKTILASFVGGSYIEKGVSILRRAGIPNYPYPERAASALNAMVKYTMFKPSKEKPERFDVDYHKVREILENVRKEGRNELGLLDMDMLSAYGITIPKYRIVRSAEEAVDAASRIGYPVVMKIVSPQISHKTEVGGVRVVSDRDEAEVVYNSMLSSVKRYAPDVHVYGVMVQEMVKGKETIVGAVEDVQFGKVLMFGLGGIYVEVLKDVSFRISPITKSEAMEMVREIKTYPLIAGVRGGERCDVDAIVECIQRISQLVEEHPEIVEFEINPLMALQKGCVAVDFRANVKWDES